jgi:predicted ATPase/DNA-binding SARP family transcriptional activator
MGEQLVVGLLGEPRFSVGATPILCTSKKALGLFAYLLLSGKPRSRRELAALFWGRGDEEGARTNLRTALHRLPEPLARCLVIDRDAIGIAASTAPLLDVTRFEALATEESLERLEDAAALYRGELLEAFDAGATADYDDWLHAARTQLRQVAHTVFDGVITRRAQRAALDAARATTERESALATARRWASLMPGVEAAHRWLMQLYIDMGQRDAALAQYALCQRELAVTQGRAPSRETRDLYAAALGTGATAIRAEEKQGAALVRAPATIEQYGVAATSFVGRVEELAELDRLLSEPHVRLVTLHGLGGAGKTRLAHALAAQIGDRFAQGVSWIALDAVASADELVAAISAALGRDLPQRGDRVAALAEALAGQQRLLVLDNFETLLAAGTSGSDADAASIVLRLLHAAPQARFIVTSREVLALQEEWVYEVRGLAFTGSDAAARAATPAVELFAQRARQAYLAFSLAAELPHVLRICNLVEGLPLGIELAAAWVRTIPCHEIAAAIEREAAALASTHRNRPARHHTLDAVVAYSWNLLEPAQQNVLAALGIFVGGFTREAAERVTGATLRILSSLVDKSLVRRRSEGRYDLHELVRQFSLARLYEMRDAHDAVARAYGDFFAAFVAHTYESLRGPGEVAAVGAITRDLPNALSAWRTSVEAGRRDVIVQMAAPLVAVLHSYGTLPASMGVAEQALAALGPEAGDDVVAEIHMQWGRAAITGGEPDVSRRELDAALDSARRIGVPSTIIYCLYYLGALEYQQGNAEAADRLAREAVALIDERTVPEIRCLVHNLLGVLLGNMGTRFELAQEHLRLALAAAREQQCPSRIGQMLCSLGVPLYYRGNFAEAAALTAEAATFYEMLGRHVTVAMVRSNLAAIAIAQGDFDTARASIESAVRLAREAGDANILSGALTTQADLFLREGELASARAAAEESLRHAEMVRHPLHITEALFLLSSIELAQGRREASLAHIRRLRDTLAEHRLEVRLPMLILATAEWLLGSAEPGEHRADARRWLAILAHRNDVDATLKEKARRLLEDEGKAGEITDAVVAERSLSAIEAEVTAILARL